jgi:Ca2+-transporting ATPase
LRVLAFAYKEVPASTQSISHEDVASDLTLAGLQAMIDPPREEAMSAIAGCRRAGIRTIMITGDHAATATALANQLGITETEGSLVLTGREMADLSDDQLREAVADVSVYARVSPHQKLRIVQALRDRGEIVAVTGDGVNDAPALKTAHIGVAMGRTGTDVAKEAAEMIVTDDNFASIFDAVREGRVVFDNIRKVVFFLIPTGVAEILSIVASILLRLPIPYLPTQILWINLVTNGLQDVALAFEPAEDDILDRPPRSPQEGLMSRLLIERTALVGGYMALGVVLNFLLALRAGDALPQARTVALTTMVFFQFFQVWNARSEHRSIFRINLFGNPILFYSLTAAFFAHLAVIYVPALQWIFGTSPLSLVEWIEVVVVSSTIIGVVEVDKWLRRRKQQTLAAVA